ncbi:uncharacterized protein L969DRAFT_95740 [Mixia osmundae IAM 14324]|uniref:Rab-GAP TBC domain-containing protein n=1 Tax=Mixia osmundae (strain CBS 9802 / IAM 14324 / JCM 22182 / KY 12970) TaxID=764103 RepID=G7E0Q1_MIXOS|nr:uncharacterized protein L969DRAFT_95740 [Mixia osmundae IAM 14324]KEI37887.1 hypothetical protein L969DRAFT_95740 [Mixia osmundae IAM 14324]GAA96411.1 hypothetical protein E5Q_03078 [Mixia osmundae IAM 14324]
MSRRLAHKQSHAGLDKLLLLPGSKSRASKAGDPQKTLKALRKTVLLEGLPDDEDVLTRTRPLTWKLFLGLTGSLSVSQYIELVSRGASPASEKIRNDTFRTLATDNAFKERVSEEMLVRLLDAFVWHAHDAPPNELQFNYVQGMNVLAAPFLYTMPSEIEAYKCFTNFIQVRCPLYVQPTLEGVHRGLELLDKCLAILDSELFAHLATKRLSAELYAFPSVMTFCACTPPLNQVLHLWDFLLAYGCHLNILCVIAQLWQIRDELLAHSSPMKMLRTFPPLDARQCIMLACKFVADLPEELYDQLARHPWDPTAT